MYIYNYIDDDDDDDDDDDHDHPDNLILHRKPMAKSNVINPVIMGWKWDDGMIVENNGMILGWLWQYNI